MISRLFNGNFLSRSEYSEDYIKKLKDEIEEKNQKLIEVQNNLDIVFDLINQVRTYSDNLKNERDMFNTVFDNVDEKVIIADDDGNIYKMNESAVNFFNIDWNKMSDLNLFDIFDIKKQANKDIVKYNEKSDNDLLINNVTKKAKIGDLNLIFL